MAFLLEQALARPELPLSRFSLLPAAQAAAARKLERHPHRGAGRRQPDRAFRRQRRAGRRRWRSPTATALTYFELAADGATPRPAPRRGRHRPGREGRALPRTVDRAGDVPARGAPLRRHLRAARHQLPAAAPGRDGRRLRPAQVLSRRAAWDSLPEATRAALGERLLLLEDLAGEAPEVALPAPNALQPALVLFTSGSTGKPKGVLVPQAGIVRLVRANRFHVFTADEVMSHAANTSFDPALIEVWGPLLAGGRIEILDQNTALSSDLLEAAIEERGITRTWRPPRSSATTPGRGRSSSTACPPSSSAANAAMPRPSPWCTPARTIRR